MSVKTGQAVYLKKSESFNISYRWVNWFVPFVLFCAVLIFVKSHLNDPLTLPVNKIRIHGTFLNINESMLHRVIDGVVAGGYFNVDVERVREVIEQLPWISKASVRRVWPDTLSVTVTEQKPVAISEEFGFINLNGGVFKPAGLTITENLPVFKGALNSNKLMLSMYFEMNMILKRIDKKIINLKLDARNSLELILDNNLRIVLGRDNVRRRLERLIKIYPKILASRANDIEYIDLRYTNGMAISWNKNNESKKGV